MLVNNDHLYCRKVQNRVKMRLKRACKPLPSTRADKTPKLTNVNAEDLEKAIARGLDEPSHEINKAPLLHTGKIVPNSSSQLMFQQLELCVRAGDEDSARRLLENQTINLKTREGGELLWLAVEEYQEEIAMVLVRHGVDVNVRKSSDRHASLLHHMLKSYRIKYETKKQNLFYLMIDHGADKNACDSTGDSVLQSAIKSHCSIELINNLLDYGAKVTYSNIWLACMYRLELVPRLIEHQVIDKQIRSERAVIAIDCLISDGYHSEYYVIEMIKKILDLDISVNVSFSKLRNQDICLLSTALRHKNKPAIKLLQEYGADPHTNVLGHTLLYHATAFKGYTDVSRWLIEKGCNIHEPNRDDGCYPIHGACENKSLRNLHLLLSLGADLNVVNNSGKTPFDLMRMSETRKCREVHHLVIKHFALMIAQGGTISARDMDRVNKFDWSREHFEKCSKQLKEMKEVKVYADISYFSLLSKNMYWKLQLMKNKIFLGEFQQNGKRRSELFPEFFYMLVHFFEIAEKRLEVLLEEKVELYDVFMGTMPDHIVEKIAYYSNFEKLERCQHEYYISFHANLKCTQSHTEQIL